MRFLAEFEYLTGGYKTNGNIQAASLSEAVELVKESIKYGYEGKVMVGELTVDRTKTLFVGDQYHFTGPVEIIEFRRYKGETVFL